MRDAGEDGRSPFQAQERQPGHGQQEEGDPLLQSCCLALRTPVLSPH